METNKTFTYSSQLSLLREGLARNTYQDYPSIRFCLPFSLLDQTNGHIVIPEGPWSTSLDSPTSDERQGFEEMGLTLDSRDRPIHPWFEAMVSDPTIGVVTGKGAYWHWGPNHTVDPAIVQDGHLLMVQRKDTGLWALPGGFLDRGETEDDAARREAREETGILIESTADKVLYSGPVADIRLTANAWPETTCLLYEVAGQLESAPIGMDDAAQAAWIPLEVAQTMTGLFGAHKMLIERVLKECGVCI